MTPPFTTLLLAATLLLSASGCSKKQDEAPATNTGRQQANGSYRINGELVTCSVLEQTYLAEDGGQTLEVIELWLVTVPQPASGEESITLVFTKLEGQLPFTLADIGVDHCRYSQVNGHSLLQRTSTVMETGGGGLSGTFSGMVRRAGQEWHFTDGVFDVHP